MIERLLTLKEAAAILQIHPDTVRKWIKEGRIPYTRVGRVLRFRESLLEQWINRRTVPAIPPKR